MMYIVMAYRMGQANGYNYPVGRDLPKANK